MRFFLPTVLVALFGFLLLPDIPSLLAQNPDDENSAEEAAQDPAEELRVAQQQLQLAHLRLTALLTDHDLGMLSAQAEVDASRSALQMFIDFEAELETANKQLALNYAQDSLADAIEELEQLSYMYERNALASATAQIVVDRAARSIERQKIEVTIQEKGLLAWRSFGLANQQKNLGHAALLAQASLEAAISNQELESAELAIETAELELQIKKLKKKITDEGTIDSAVESTESEG